MAKRPGNLREAVIVGSWYDCASARIETGHTATSAAATRAIRYVQRPLRCRRRIHVPGVHLRPSLVRLPYPPIARVAALPDRHKHPRVRVVTLAHTQEPRPHARHHLRRLPELRPVRYPDLQSTRVVARAIAVALRRDHAAPVRARPEDLRQSRTSALDKRPRRERERLSALVRPCRQVRERDLIHVGRRKCPAV